MKKSSNFLFLIWGMFFVVIGLLAEYSIFALVTGGISIVLFVLYTLSDKRKEQRRTLKTCGDIEQTVGPSADKLPGVNTMNETWIHIKNVGESGFCYDAIYIDKNGQRAKRVKRECTYWGHHDESEWDETEYIISVEEAISLVSPDDEAIAKIQSIRNGSVTAHY